MTNKYSLYAMLCASFLVFSIPSYAKRTPEEQAAKDAAKAAKKAAKAAADQRVRLIAKVEIEDDEEEVANAPEFKVDFRSRRGEHKLSGEVENIADGTVVTIMVGNINIGTVTIAAGVGEIEFEDDNWPTGLPLELPVGTAVRWLSGNAELAASTLQPK